MPESRDTPAAVLVTLTLACSAEEPTGTEHLVLHASETPVCAGTRVDADADVDRIASAFGLVPVARIGLYYGESEVAERCPEGASGCASRWDDQVWIAADGRVSLVHEIVHAVRRQHRLDGPRVFEEGLAQVLRGREDLWAGSALDVNAPRPGPVELMGLSTDEYYERDGLYIFAGSIVDWMIDAFGRDAVLAFTTDPAFEEDMPHDAVEAVIFDYLGVRSAELDARYHDDAPWDWDVGTRCPDGSTQPLGGGQQWSGTLSCDDPDTLGPEADSNGELYTASRSWCFSVTETSMVRARFDAAGGLLIVVPGDHDAGRGISVDPGSSMDVELEAGSWQLRVYSESLEPLTWSVDVERVE